MAEIIYESKLMNDENLNGKTAVLYRRVSTTEQKDYGMSLSNQSEQLRSFCYRNNIEVVQDFEEDYSAKDFNRPVFSELLKFVAQNKIELTTYS